MNLHQLLHKDLFIENLKKLQDKRGSFKAFEDGRITEILFEQDTGEYQQGLPYRCTLPEWVMVSSGDIMGHLLEVNERKETWRKYNKHVNPIVMLVNKEHLILLREDYRLPENLIRYIASDLGDDIVKQFSEFYTGEVMKFNGKYQNTNALFTFDTG